MRPQVDVTVTPLREINADPTVQKILDLAAQTFVERLGAGYERQRSQGGAEFSADIWYRMRLMDSRPSIEFVVGVGQPVYGLAPYVSRLASSMAEGFEWNIHLDTKVRLLQDIDERGLADAGWRHCTFPPEVEPPILSTGPPPAGHQAQLVDA